MSNTTYLHRHEDRGHVQANWLNTYHSFSFGQWQDPRFMGVSALRVINEDTVSPHTGFSMHAHDNMEILTCVLSGTLTHKDSMGNHGYIHAGDWQLMSAGSGVRHSEVNDHDTPVHLLQIWLHPNVKNADPTYQQVQLNPKDVPNTWHLIAGEQSSAKMHIRQDAEIKTAYLTKGHELTVKTLHGLNYVHVIQGQITIGETTVKTGDAFVFSDVSQVIATEDTQIIWFDLPAKA